MHHLIVDTCVWVDLAVTEFSLAEKLARLIEDGKARIVVPELIKTEWDGCKESIVEQITAAIVESRRSAIRLMSLVDGPDWTEVSDRISSVDPISAGAKLGAQRIEAIEGILDSDVIIGVPVSGQAKALAVDHALQKKAPFRSCNSMADALIFFAAVEWAKAERPDRAVFVTHNTKDFSDLRRGDEGVDFKERLAPDLQVLADENRLGFEVVMGRALNDIEQSVVTKEEIDRGEAVVESARILDDVLEVMLSGAVFAKMVDQQRKAAEMLSGGVVVKMLDQQRRAAEMLSGGVVAKMLDQHRQMRPDLD